jgi:hypothetical protein
VFQELLPENRLGVYQAAILGGALQIFHQQVFSFMFT